MHTHTPSTSSPRNLLCSSGHANHSEETSHRSLLEASLQSLPLSSHGLPCVPLLSLCESLCCKNTHWTVKVKVKSLSRVRLFATPWTVAYQAPPSMGFSRQEYWSGLPFPSPGDLPDPGIEPGSPAFQADALTSEPAGKPHFSVISSQSLP